jgi:GTP-binding protein
MLDEVVKHFPEDAQQEYDDEVIKIAIIGKPNVGKSSLINKILGEERVIVSDIPGTTRDAVDTPVTIGENKYVFIDTAGIRRKSKIKEDIEKYSIVRTVSAIERADVAVLVIDASEGITEQDTKIAGIAHERGKAAIIVMNKWDTIEKDNKTMNKYLKEIETKLSYMSYAPRLFISAMTGQRVHKLFETINGVAQNHSLRISTGLLNDVLIEAMAMNQPPSDKGKRLKIYYMTQVSIKPPTFVIFVNDKQLMHFSYQRYIGNQLREAFGFKGTPLHFIIREKTRKE